MVVDPVVVEYGKRIPVGLAKDPSTEIVVKCDGCKEMFDSNCGDAMKTGLDFCSNCKYRSMDLLYRAITWDGKLVPIKMKGDNAIVKKKFIDYRKGAESRGLEFDLRMDDFHTILLRNCSYCDVKGISKMGVDRVNNNVGYKKSNVTPCCWPCNRMKGSMTFIEFLSHIRKMNKTIDRFELSSDGGSVKIIDEKFDIEYDEFDQEESVPQKDIVLLLIKKIGVTSKTVLLTRLYSRGFRAKDIESATNELRNDGKIRHLRSRAGLAGRPSVSYEAL